MAITTLLTEIRRYLGQFLTLKVEEKRMFKGLAIMINDKMCLNISEEKLMCRFDPALQEEVQQKKGFETMIMKGKELSGYCSVNPEGFQHEQDFVYWMKLCLDYNARAKSSEKNK